MKIEKFSINSCCGKKILVIKIGAPITKDLIKHICSNGFSELAHFTSQGMMYIENKNLIITGPIGADSMQVKCRSGDCNKHFSDLENILSLLP